MTDRDDYDSLLPGVGEFLDTFMIRKVTAGEDQLRDDRTPRPRPVYRRIARLREAQPLLRALPMAHAGRDRGHEVQIVGVEPEDPEEPGEARQVAPHHPLEERYAAPAPVSVEQCLAELPEEAGAPGRAAGLLNALALEKRWMSTAGRSTRASCAPGSPWRPASATARAGCHMAEPARGRSRSGRDGGSPGTRSDRSAF